MASDGAVVLPGDLVDMPTDAKIRVGPGLRVLGDSVG